MQHMRAISLSFCCQSQWEGNQGGPTVEHMELCSLLWGSLRGRGLGGEWIHVFARLSLLAAHLKPSQRCLLIGYTPIQNKKFKNAVKI